MKMIFSPKWALCGLLLLQLHQAQVFAQSSATPREKPPLPPGDLICGIGPKDSWTITFEYLPSGHADTSTDSPKPPNPNNPSSQLLGEPKKVTINRLDPYIGVRFFDSSSKCLFGFYSANQELFFLSEEKSKPIRTSISEKTPGESLPIGFEILYSTHQNKFHDFDWVSADNYVSAEIIGDTPCFVFKKGELQAWIDQVKLHPVLWKSKSEIRRFKNNGQSVSRDIPEAVMESLRGIVQDREALKKSPKGG